MVEHGIENPGVAGSIPALPTTYRKHSISHLVLHRFPFIFEVEIYGYTLSRLTEQGDIAQEDSKIRNGLGIKNEKLY